MGNEEKKLILKQSIGRRVERGHLWVFSNEVEDISGEFAPGDEVHIYSAKNKFMGMGLLSKSSLIRARIYSRIKNQKFDLELIKNRLKSALDFRKENGISGESFRLIHSESDGLPGIIIDIYGEHTVIQILTAAAEKHKENIINAIHQIIAPKSIIERSDVPFRELEGLSQKKEILYGNPEMPCKIIDNGAIIFADLINGQKTGYFLDQKENRNRFLNFCPGKRILDLFCYIGGWALNAALADAKEVWGIDSSASALELANKSAEINNIKDKCHFIEMDVFKYLRASSEKGDKFDIIIVDPPAFAKTRKDIISAVGAYRDLNFRAMKLLNDNGILISCSCSHHLSTQDFYEMLIMSAKDANSDFSVIAQPVQPPDHPIHLQTPETSYLKTFFLRKRKF